VATALLSALVLALGAMARPAWAQDAPRTRYGEATVEQGSMTLVRSGRKFDYTQAEPAVVVVYGDVVVVNGNSRVVVQTVEGARLTIGANAAFQVKPFKQREQLGVLRLLFGRIRAKLVQLQAGHEFAIKTAQAVIGVKGTEFVTSVTAQGDTLVVVQETQHVVELTGLEGPQRKLTPDLMAAVVNNKPASNVALVTPQVRQELALADLDSPAAYQPQAKSLRGEQALVRSGIVSEKDLVESRRDRATLQDAVPFEQQAPPIRQRYELQPQETRPFLQWNLLLRPSPEGGP